MNIDWMEDQDLSWVNDLRKEIATEKENKTNSDGDPYFDPDNCFVFDKTIEVKDFDKDDFPLSHDWSERFVQKHKNAQKISDQKMADIIKTAKQIVKIDSLTIYVSCEDGNHYFSTPDYANGAASIAFIDDNSEFDSACSAVHAFINAHKEWQEEDSKVCSKT